RVPRLWRVSSVADSFLDNRQVESFRSSLLGTLADPGAYSGADDPAQLIVRELSDRRARLEFAVDVDQLAGTFDGCGSCLPLAFGFDSGAHWRTHLHFAHSGLAIAFVAAAGCWVAGAASGAGALSGWCHSLRFGVMASSRVFLAGYCPCAGSMPI